MSFNVSGSAIGQFQWREDALLTLALLVLWLWRLGAAPLFDVDEGAFAEATREMLASGDWLHTTLQGEDRFDKPILIYWLQLACAAVFGVNEWAVRLPSALCALVTALAVGRFVTARKGRHAGWMTAFALSTCLGFLSIGRAATADSLLNMLLVLTGLSLWQFLESGALASLRWACAWMALGLLAKGPVAVLVPGAAFCLWSIWHDRGRPILRALRDPVSWLIVLVIALPWYVYAIHRHGDAFIQGFFMKHNVGRFSSPMHGHSGNWAYYLVVWPVLCLPWSVLLLAVLQRSRQLWRDPLSCYLWIWAVFVLVFFSFSGTKLPHYLLYGTAPMVMLMVQVLPAVGAAVRRILWASLFGVCLLFAALPWIAQHESARIAHPLYRQFIETAPSMQSLWWGMGVTGLAMIWLAILRRYTSATRLTAAAYVLALGVASWVVPWWSETLQGAVRTLAQASRAHEGRVMQVGLNRPSFAFYRERMLFRSAPVAGDWVLLPEHELARLKLPWTLQFASRGLAVVRVDAAPEESKPATGTPGGG